MQSTVAFLSLGNEKSRNEKSPIAKAKMRYVRWNSSVEIAAYLPTDYARPQDLEKDL